MNVTSSAVLDQVIADHAGVVLHAAEKKPLAAVMDIVVLDQRVCRSPVRIDRVVVRAAAFLINIRHFIVLNCHIVRKVQLDPACPDILKHISLDQGVTAARQVDPVAGICRCALIDVVVLNDDIAVGLPVAVYIVRSSAGAVAVRPSRILAVLIAGAVPLLDRDRAKGVIDEAVVLDHDIAELSRLVPGRA